VISPPRELAGLSSRCGLEFVATGKKSSLPSHKTKCLLWLG